MIIYVMWLKLKAKACKLTLLHGCFSRFLNCTNATKSRNALHMTDAIHDKHKIFKRVVSRIFSRSAL